MKYFILKKTIHLFFKDYIVPPQENNALFLMTNFIRTDQEHKRCPGIKFV
jgi:hypothetical protein